MLLLAYVIVLLTIKLSLAMLDHYLIKKHYHPIHWFFSNTCNARPVFWLDPCVVCSRLDQRKCVVAHLLSMCSKKQERFAGSPRRSVTNITAGRSYGGPRLIWSGLDRYCLLTTTLCPKIDWFGFTLYFMNSIICRYWRRKQSCVLLILTHI